MATCACDRRAGGLTLIAAAAAVAVAALSVSGSAQQQPSVDRPPDSSKAKNIVAVRGCVTGSTLTSTSAGEYTSDIPSDLRLNGSRAIRRLLKELEGHLVEVTGNLKGTGQATGALVKDTGKTKIYVGTTERRIGPDTSDVDQQMRMERQRGPTLEVASVKDIAGVCTKAQE